MGAISARSAVAAAPARRQPAPRRAYRSHGASKTPAAWIFSASLALGVGSAAVAQGVVPDKATPTTATVQPSGKITVDIAPSNGRGVSHNTYSRFDVPTAGVDLNNQSIKAGLIINEVTSANRTYMQGPLAVLGPKANVVVANPNGITVDGGSFINIGALGLFTGPVRMNDGRPELEVTRGDVLIDKGGLSAAVQQLDVVARSIQVRGNIEDTAVPKSMNLALASGNATVSIDPGPSPSAPGGWTTTVSVPTEVKEASLVIEQGAALGAGSIRLTATDKGAGVRFAGDASSTGEFWITADGKVIVDDARIRAERDIFIAGKSVALTSSKKSASLTASQGGVTIKASEDIVSKGVTYQGAAKPGTGFAYNGAVNLVSDGGIDISAGAGPSSLASSADDVVVQAAATLRISGTGLSSARDLVFSGKDAITFDRVTATSTGLVRMTTDGSVAVTASNLAAGTSAIVDTGSFSIASTSDVRSTLTATSSGVLIVADSTVDNIGALIQGSSPVEGDDRSVGGVTVRAGGLITVRTTSLAAIGAIYAASADLFVSSETGVRNLSGRLLADKTVFVSTSGAFDNVTATTRRSDGRNPTPSSTGIDYGTYVAGREVASVTGTEGVSIEARTVLNSGEILGHEIAVEADKVTNRPALLGRVLIETKCVLIFFCHSTSISNVSRDGGTIAASSTLTITAGTRLVNEGGILSGVNGLTVTAPVALFKAQLIPQAYSRPGGLLSGFFGDWSRIFYGFEGGILAAQQGSITLHVPGNIIAESLQISRDGELLVDGILVERREPASLKTKNRKRIGILSGVL